MPSPLGKVAFAKQMTDEVASECAMQHALDLIRPCGAPSQKGKALAGGATPPYWEKPDCHVGLVASSQ